MSAWTLRLSCLVLLGLFTACVPVEPLPDEPTPSEPTPAPAALGDPLVVLDVLSGLNEATDLELAGDLAYVCGNGGGIKIIDVSDPEAMELASVWQDIVRCDHISVDPGQYLYLASHAQGGAPFSAMALLDLSDPIAPVLLDNIQTELLVEGVTHQGDLLLIAAHDDGLVLMRREDDRLTELGRVATGGNAWQVRLGPDGLAYVVNGEDGLAVVDVSTPSDPAVVGALELPGSAGDLEIRGDRAFVGLRGAGLAYVDLSTPRSPTLLQHLDTPGSVLGVAPTDDGSSLLISDWNDLRIYDVVDDELVFVGREELELAVPPPGTSEFEPARSGGVAVQGSVYLSSNWFEVTSLGRVPDVSGPDLSISPRVLTMPSTDGGGSSSALARIHSSGPRPVTVSAVTAQGSGFSVDALELPLVLEPGEDVAVLVRYSGGGSAEGTLSVDSDDVDRPSQLAGLRAGVPGLTVGDSAGDPSFLDLDGQAVLLSALLDGPVLLAYFATF